MSANSHDENTSEVNDLNGTASQTDHQVPESITHMSDDESQSQHDGETNAATQEIAKVEGINDLTDFGGVTAPISKSDAEPAKVETPKKASKGGKAAAKTTPSKAAKNSSDPSKATPRKTKAKKGDAASQAGDDGNEVKPEPKKRARKTANGATTTSNTAQKRKADKISDNASEATRSSVERFITSSMFDGDEISASLKRNRELKAQMVCHPIQ